MKILTQRKTRNFNCRGRIIALERYPESIPLITGCYVCSRRIHFCWSHASFDSLEQLMHKQQKSITKVFISKFFFKFAWMFCLCFSFHRFNFVIHLLYRKKSPIRRNVAVTRDHNLAKESLNVNVEFILYVSYLMPVVTGCITERNHKAALFNVPRSTSCTSYCLYF